MSDTKLTQQALRMNKQKNNQLWLSAVEVHQRFRADVLDTNTALLSARHHLHQTIQKLQEAVTSFRRIQEDIELQDAAEFDKEFCDSLKSEIQMYSRIVNDVHQNIESICFHAMELSQLQGDPTE